ATGPVQLAGPAPVSLQPYRAVTDWFNSNTAPFGGVVTEIDGPFLSIRLPPIGPAVAQFPLTSQTVRLPGAAFAFSLPAPTAVTSKNDASASPFASPEPLSVAVQARATLSACHMPSGTAHTILGETVSPTVSENVAVLLQPVSDPSSSVACTVNVNTPVAFVVPDRTPLVERDKPVGSAPLTTSNLNGSMPPDALNSCRYGTPASTLGKVAAMVIAGHVDIPLRATTCVSPVVLDMVSVALFVPSVVGWKVTEAVVDDPAFTVVAPGWPTLKSPAFVPEIANGVESDIDAAASFAIVTVALDVVPRAFDPKSIGAGDTVRAGVMRLARSCGTLGAIGRKSLALSFVSTPLPLAPPGFRS